MLRKLLKGFCRGELYCASFSAQYALVPLSLSYSWAKSHGVLPNLFFGESPSLSMLVGSALVIVSGIYLMWREHVVK